ncbi:MAG: methyltransferase domain-containing protein [Planctomycetota bacterium]|nr:methyltransferase domain-containing protein [Planctomycetota bacterium]
MSTLRKLHLGCGTDILAGWVNVDCVALPGVDVVHDLNVLPLPFADASMEEIKCQDVLEHVKYPPLLKECHRILAPGGKVHIRVPHFTSHANYIDPTHINRFAAKTFNFFVGDTYEGKFRGYYFDFKFATYGRKHITFPKPATLKICNSAMEWLANRSPRAQTYYELTGWSRLFPAMNLEVTLVK